MKRSENIARSQLKTGIFVVIALLLFALGVLLMGEQTKMFKGKGRISVIMTDVAGLKAGAPVWLSGIDIGVVRSVGFEHPEKSNEVAIVLEVERGALKKIGTDSVITIRTRGLMGEKYVDISPSAHLVTKPVTRIYGTNLPKLDDVMQKASLSFDYLNQTMKRVASGQGSMGMLVADSKLYVNLSKLTGELNSFVATANRGEGTIGKLNQNPEVYDRLVSTLVQADQTMTTITRGRGTLNKLINERELYDKLLSFADEGAQAAQDVQEIKESLLSPNGSTGAFINDKEFYNKGMVLIDRADRSLKSLEEVLDRVNSGNGTAGKLVNDELLYQKMNKAADDLGALLQDIRQHPKRYFKFSLF